MDVRRQSLGDNFNLLSTEFSYFAKVSAVLEHELIHLKQLFRDYVSLLLAQWFGWLAWDLRVLSLSSCCIELTPGEVGPSLY